MIVIFWLTEMYFLLVISVKLLKIYIIYFVA